MHHYCSPVQDDTFELGLPTIQWQKKKIEKGKCKSKWERGGELANKDRFCTTIGKKKEQLWQHHLRPWALQHTTQQKPEEVARPKEALEVINHFNLKPVKIPLTLSPSLCWFPCQLYVQTIWQPFSPSFGLPLSRRITICNCLKVLLWTGSTVNQSSAFLNSVSLSC